MSGGKDKAMIRDAACNWLNELTEHIVPNVLTKQERKAYKKQRDELSEAIFRDAQRRRRAAAHAGPSKRAFWLEFHAPAVHTLARDFHLTPRQIAKRLADLSREERRLAPHLIIETYRQRMEEINAVPAGEGPAVAGEDPDPEEAEELVVRFDWVEVRENSRAQARNIPAKDLIRWCKETGRDPRAFGPEELRLYLSDVDGDYVQYAGCRFESFKATPQQFVTASVGE